MSSHAVPRPVVATRRASRGLETLRREKVRFNQTVLKLPLKKAQEWADRTVKIVEAGERLEESTASNGS